MTGPNRSAERTREEDRRLVKKVKMLLGGIAGSVLLVIIIALVIYDPDAPQNTPVPSFDRPDPVSAVSAGDFSAQTVELLLFEMSRLKRTGSELPRLPVTALSGISEVYLGAQPGFRAAGKLLELFGAPVEPAKAWKGFLTRAARDLNPPPERLRELARWLEEFKLEDFKPGQLGTVADCRQQINDFWAVLKPHIASRRTNPDLTELVTRFAQKLSYLEGARGDLEPMLKTLTESVTHEDATLVYSLAPLWRSFLEPVNVAPLHRLISDSRTSDSVFSATANALGQIGAPNTPRVILTSLSGRSNSTIASALMYLKNWDLGDNLEPVLNWACNSNPEIASGAFAALGRPGQNNTGYSRAFERIYPKVTPEARSDAIVILGACPPEEFPLEALIKYTINNTALIRRTAQAIKGLPFDRVARALSSRVSTSPLALKTKTKEEQNSVTTLLFACADANAGSLAVEAFKSEATGGLSEERMAFALRLLAAAIANTGSAELKKQLSEIAQAAPTDATRSLAAKLLTSGQ